MLVARPGLILGRQDDPGPRLSGEDGGAVRQISGEELLDSTVPARLWAKVSACVCARVCELCE